MHWKQIAFFAPCNDRINCSTGLKYHELLQFFYDYGAQALFERIRGIHQPVSHDIHPGERVSSCDFSSDDMFFPFEIFKDSSGVYHLIVDDRMEVIQLDVLINFQKPAEGKLFW